VILSIIFFDLPQLKNMLQSWLKSGAIQIEMANKAARMVF